jgi:hypothetical protein
MSLSPQFMESLWVRKYVHISYDITGFSPVIVYRTFSAAGHTLLVYDYLLTFRDEVSLLDDMHHI